MHDNESPITMVPKRVPWNKGKQGAKDYVINDHMTGGFALMAYPASHGDSGVMTFMVNQDGIVYQKNLGTATPRIAQQITQYDPDPSWQASEP